MEVRIGAVTGGASTKKIEVSESTGGRANLSRVRDVISMEGGASSRRNHRHSNEELFKSGGGVREEQVIRWERFLPRKFLRVLLVENDDSTRHIVSALLRKCNYQVSAVADGIKAWTVLKERHYNFDIVLTELVMPSLSGMGLLSKIMNSEICKTIPVIMMSSNDSIGIVFKCMLKGAADFLVKPVRKNELRNLWQHVWRKYCSSSCGDGSENGNQNHTQTKLETVSDNEVASNHGSANVGNRFKSEDSSDKGSGTQSSCRKPEMEIDSGQKSEVPLQIENTIFLKDADSNIKKNAYDISKLATSSAHEKGKAKDKLVELESKVTPSMHEAISTEKVWGKTSRYEHGEKEPASLTSREGGNIGPKSTDQNDGTKKLPKQVIEFIGRATTRQYCNQGVDDNDHSEDVLYASARSSDTTRNICFSGSSPLLELSLRRSQSSPREEKIQGKHALNHSVASAFSRYKNASSLPSPRTGSLPASFFSKTNECRTSNRHICPSADHGIIFPHSEMSTSPHEGEGRIHCQLSSGWDKEDADPSPSVPSRVTACMGICFPKKEVLLQPQLGGVPFPIPVGALPFQSMCSGYGSIVQPVFYPEPSLRLCGSAEGQNESVVIPSNPSAQYSNHLIQHVNSHHYIGNPHPLQLKQVMEAQRFDIEPTYPRVMFQPPAEKVNVGGNCFVAISRGSNGNCEGMSVVANTGTALADGNEDGVHNCYEKGLDLNNSRREEALNKFRMKRKERCFEKKVRYHNRKKLAEQRPRLKGQFVRQVVGGSTTKATGSDD